MHSSRPLRLRFAAAPRRLSLGVGPVKPPGQVSSSLLQGVLLQEIEMADNKTLGDKVTDAICMAPLHATGLTAVTAAFDVLGSLFAGEKPETKDVVRASGLIDTDTDSRK